MLAFIAALLACTPPVSVPPAASPALTALPSAPAAAPSAPGPGRPVVTTERQVSYSGVALSDTITRRTEVARQGAAKCHAEHPDFVGVLALDVHTDAEGHVDGVYPGAADVPVPPCVEAAVRAVRYPTSYSEFPGLSIHITWRFAVVPDLDPDHACTADADCGLVASTCSGPEAVALPAAARVDAERQKILAIEGCAGKFDPPQFARCVEGTCTAIPADLSDMRGCAHDADCAVIERWCAWDTVSSSRADEARSIVKPENDDLACDAARPAAPAARCRYGQCTLQWAAK